MNDPQTTGVTQAAAERVARMLSQGTANEVRRVMATAVRLGHARSVQRAATPLERRDIDIQAISRAAHFSPDFITEVLDAAFGAGLLLPADPDNAT